MARYHRWATERLVHDLEAVPDETWYGDAGLFFRSIHGTLNHLGLADRLWLGRMTGVPFPVTGLDQELVSERRRVGPWLLEGAEAILGFVAGLDEGRLGARFEYARTDGSPQRGLLGPTLCHVFNHGTHHRGQVSAAMTASGHRAPELDLLYFMREEAGGAPP